MRAARVYLPLSAAQLEALAGPGQSVTPTIGYAVTDRLERAHPGADEEQLEYAAFQAASAEAARRLAGKPERRVVAAADVDRAALVDEDAPDEDAPDELGRVRLGAPVLLRTIVSLHVDEQPGSDDGLQWYDVTELQSVRALLG